MLKGVSMVNESQTDHAGKPTEHAKVFVSYSRDDVGISDQIVMALKANNFQPIIDRTDIAAAEDWKERLGDMILSADTVLFVLTKSSAGSQTCAWEAEYAASLGKRLIPVLVEPLDGVTPPDQLVGINYIYLYTEKKMPGTGFWTGVETLSDALRADIEWIRDQTRVSVIANRWLAQNRFSDLLLRGDELEYYLLWRARKPESAPELSELIIEFLDESVFAAEEREKSELNESRRRQRLYLSVSSVLMLLLVICLIAVIQVSAFYLSTEQSIRNTIDDEVETVQSLYEYEGIDVVKQVIRQRTAWSDDSIFLLVKASTGRVFAGNLTALPSESIMEGEQFFQFYYERPLLDPAGKEVDVKQVYAVGKLIGLRAQEGIDSDFLVMLAKTRRCALFECYFVSRLSV